MVLVVSPMDCYSLFYVIVCQFFVCHGMWYMSVSDLDSCVPILYSLLSSWL